jgi:hypothetical protein
MESESRKLAKIMYDAYCKAVGGVAFNGDALPGSEEFFSDPTKAKQRDGWDAAAEAALANM